MKLFLPSPLTITSIAAALCLLNTLISIYIDRKIKVWTTEKDELLKIKYDIYNKQMDHLDRVNALSTRYDSVSKILDKIQKEKCH